VAHTTLVWFRDDLRLHDNPALAHAVASSDRVIPVYLHSPAEAGDWQAGAASNWWLHHSLAELAAALEQLGSRLVIEQGPSALPLLQQLIETTGAEAVCWNRLYQPWALARDDNIEKSLQIQGVSVDTFRAGLLFEPRAVCKDNGEPYRVFTAFWKRCQSLGLYQPASSTPARLPGEPLHAGCTLDKLQLLPTINWDRHFQTHWQPGETHALQRAETFLSGDIEAYEEARDRPALAGTSCLSASLHFGECSPRSLVNHCIERLDMTDDEAGRLSIRRFMAELGWREFASHILYNNPASTDTSMNPRFEHFPWQQDTDHALQSWQQGMTGFPIIDAGMRQLWQTGWMHNRVRMLVASLLTKNLRLHWLHGARWFWDTLVDADLASNSLGWQWVAGCGTDAAPYFRIFNPVLQGKKFDPQGSYVRQWVPELAGLDARIIHEPWKAGGVPDYPEPLVSLKDSRESALQAFRSL
jgi:deoxyribodipyrimidine photo-lyase